MGCKPSDKPFIDEPVDKANKLDLDFEWVWIFFIIARIRFIKTGKQLRVD